MDQWLSCEQMQASVDQPRLGLLRPSYIWIRSLLRPKRVLLLVATLLYLALLVSFSQQLAGSHPDEYGKVNQIVSGERNWNHPQLLLTNLQIARALFPSDKKSELVQIGRYVSNIYAAATVFVFSVVGLRLFGAVWSGSFLGCSLLTAQSWSQGAMLRRTFSFSSASHSFRSR